MLVAAVYFYHVWYPLKKDTDPVSCQGVAELAVPVVVLFAAAALVAARVPFAGSAVVLAARNFAEVDQLKAVAVVGSASADCAELAGNTVVADNTATFVIHTLASFGDTVGFPD